MNPLTRCFVAAFTLAALVPAAIAAESAPAAAAPASRVIMIANLTEKVAGVSAYETWQGAMAVAQKAGFAVLGAKGAQGNGGFGQTLETPIDLSQCAYIELALAVQPGNEVPEYTIMFVDGDGTQCWARVRVDQLMPGQPLWMRVKVSDFTVSTKDKGADGRMDWSKIAQWHLQGDWTTKKPAHILFMALRGRT
ncbi:MAG TPA: hypothetical protein VHE61_02505 [Opitutaceae bacterium]|nr:hypothetical protein [Opitutaceae bacterium]